MSPVDAFLLVIAAIFVVGIAGELVFAKTGVPDVVWLIAVGVLIGPVAGWVPRDRLVEIAPYFGALTLLVVLFEGGTELRLAELGRAAPRAAILALLGFAISAAVVALASMGAAALGWLADWGWLQAATLGAILGGSSSVVIMPALRLARLGPAVTSVVTLESALTDALCVVVTAACIRVSTSGATDLGSAGVELARSFGIGVGVGGVAGLLALLVLRRIASSAHAYPLTLGALLVVYVIIDALEGSAALGILVAAVLIGNAPVLSEKVGLRSAASLGEGVRGVHDQITFIVKSFFFTFIGAMLCPPWGAIGIGVALGLLLLAARVPAVWLATLGAPLQRAERGLVTVSMPRGMAAGVLATMPAAASPPMPGTGGLPVIVFACVLTTVAVFAIGFPLMKRRVRAAPVEEPRGEPEAVLEGGEPIAVGGEAEPERAERETG